MQFENVQPQLVINASAYTAVDQAESEPEAAMAVNGRAPGELAAEADRIGAGLIHYSTDYVFDGTKGEAHREGDQPNPLNVYGESKLAGERAIQEVDGAWLILRTSWVYSLRRPSFVTKVLEWARSHDVLRVVDDQVGNPTWCRMLAEASAQLIAMAAPDPAPWLKARRGLYHLAGDGYGSRYDWARAILRYDPDPGSRTASGIEPTSTREFPLPAARPTFSALDCEHFARTFGLRLPGWEQALRLAMAAQ